MGCFLSCIRFKNHRGRNRDMIDSKKRDPEVQRNGLLSIFIDEDENTSVCDYEDPHSLRPNASDFSIDRELKHEAKFLKSCGVLLNSPVELHKTSDNKLMHDSDYESPLKDQHLLLSDAFGKVLNLDEQTNESSHPSEQILDDRTNNLEIKPIGCNSIQHDRSRRVVQFEDTKHIAGIKSGADSLSMDISPSQTENGKQALRSNNSSYPTPLNLSDEMQTPGTVYTATKENLRSGKKVKVRTQYLYPVLKPVENLPQWKRKREESPSFGKTSELEHQIKASRIDGRQNTHTATATFLNPSMGDTKKSVFEEGKTCSISLSNAPLQTDGNLHGKHLRVASLSQWLKPLPVNDEKESRGNFEYDVTPMNKGPEGDGPFSGAFASYWFHDQLTHKSWDGNGIPNTTTKYKEDQQVNWHATPFEVRLEKALSDERRFPQWKDTCGKPVEYNEESKKLIS